MTGFRYSDEERHELLKLLPETANATFVILALESTCDNFVDRVRFCRPLAAEKTASDAAAIRRALDQIPLDATTETAFDAMFSETLQAGYPPERSMAEAALGNKIDWFDFRRYMARRELLKALGHLEAHIPDDQARNFQVPREELFERIFRIWEMAHDRAPNPADVQQVSNTPAQDFIRAATQRAWDEAAILTPGGESRPFPDEKTIKRAIEKAFKADA